MFHHKTILWYDNEDVGNDDEGDIGKVDEGAGDDASNQGTGNTSKDESIALESMGDSLSNNKCIKLKQFGCLSLKHPFTMNIWFRGT